MPSNLIDGVKFITGITSVNLNPAPTLPSTVELVILEIISPFELSIVNAYDILSIYVLDIVQYKYLLYVEVGV